jgi:hypothetical protein
VYNILIEFGVPMKVLRPIKMCLNETYTEVRIGKYLSYNFLTQSGRRRRCFNATAFHLCFRISHRKVHENQVGLKLSGTHQLLVYADNVNLLRVKTDTIMKNTQTLTDARSKHRGI